MTTLIVIGCIILFFVFILSLKATITVEYKDEVALFVKVLFIKIRLLPSEKKKSGPHSMSDKRAKKIKAKLLQKERKKKEKKKQKKAQKLAEKHKQKKSLSDILDILSLVKDLLAKVIKIFFGHLKVKVARLKIKVATGDAASTAIAYGLISQAAMYLFTALAPLDGLTLPRKKNTEIVCDYLSDEMEIDLKISLSIRVWHVLHVGIGALSTFICHKLKGQNKK